MTQLLISSELLSLSAEVRLHVQHVRTGAGGPAILLIHGLAEDKHIYHLNSGGGLAVFLAEAGFDVYIGELRGYGKSKPALKPGMEISQHQIITEDLPAFFDLIQRNHPDEPFFAAGHGWGSVLLASALIRRPEVLGKVAGLVHFAGSRARQAGLRPQSLPSELLWRRVAPLIGRRKGLIPACSLGIGSADVSLRLHAEHLQWAWGGEWRDQQDAFDYALALRTLAWPAGLYLAGNDDHHLGHFSDVKAFACELGEHDAQIIRLKKGTGCSRDYGHNDLLTHPQAEVDHFPLVLSWLEQHSPEIPSQLRETTMRDTNTN
ncbi:alpha/beta hydrolase [Pseudomonas sp. gcc21]|uniref:alpha/beta fold hydrolase n=1 Tax=Pseudomonas sp. gcc21 TaxID=2726989 RepID=UPI00145197D6|nr:alpha/beta fold hydrolase [Pseudomonas sp. gcc21]QJD58144.1 alpha/beta hydrolase [Pseudomonas sp. gcc21]